MKEEKQVLLLSSKVAKKTARDDDNGGCFETGSGSAASSAQEAENGATFTKSYDQRFYVRNIFHDGGFSLRNPFMQF